MKKIKKQENLPRLLALLKKQNSELWQKFNQVITEIKKSVLVGEIYSAIPLEKKEKEEIAKQLEKIFKKPVLLKNIVQKEILGGIKIIVDGRVIDLSLAGRLLNFKNRLVKGVTVNE